MIYKGQDDLGEAYIILVVRVSFESVQQRSSRNGEMKDASDGLLAAAITCSQTALEISSLVMADSSGPDEERDDDDDGGARPKSGGGLARTSTTMVG